MKRLQLLRRTHSLAAGSNRLSQWNPHRLFVIQQNINLESFYYWHTSITLQYQSTVFR